MVEASTASLNVAVVTAAGLTLVAASDGNLEVTVGAVVSAGGGVVKTTSTQYFSERYVLFGNDVAALYLYRPFAPSAPSLKACSGGLSTAAARNPSSVPV